VSSDHQIVVRGEAQQQAPADLAGLSVVVQVDHAEQDAAFRRASEVAALVDTVLEAHAAALGTRQAAVVVVRPTTRWVDGEEQRTGWRAARATSLDVIDLSLVTPLLAELVAAGAIVHGPFWRLRPDHPVYDEVRGLAAANAHQRAEAYASALGLRVGRVDWVAEPGLRLADHVGGADGWIASQTLARGGAAADGSVEVAQAELTVTAAVEVGFAIER
jgi:uncharacterized protein